MTGAKEGMEKLLKTLKDRGFKLFGLTNWGDVIHKIIARHSIFKLLDGMVFSSEEQLIKPDRPIYRCLIERNALNPSECLFAVTSKSMSKVPKPHEWKRSTLLRLRITPIS